MFVSRNVISPNGSPFGTMKLPDAVVKHLVIIALATIGGTMLDSSMNPIMLWLSFLGVCWVINDALKTLPQFLDNQSHLHVYSMASAMTPKTIASASLGNPAPDFNTENLASNEAPISSANMEAHTQILAEFIHPVQSEDIRPYDSPSDNHHHGSPILHDYTLASGNLAIRNRPLLNSVTKTSVCATDVEQISPVTEMPEANVQLSSSERDVSHLHGTLAAGSLSGFPASVATGNFLGLAIDTPSIDTEHIQSGESGPRPDLFMLSRLNSLDLGTLPTEWNERGGLPVAQSGWQTSLTTSIHGGPPERSTPVNALLEAVNSLLANHVSVRSHADLEFNSVNLAGPDNNIFRASRKHFVTLPTSPSDDLQESDSEVCTFPTPRNNQQLLLICLKVATNISTRSASGLAAHHQEITIEYPVEVVQRTVPMQDIQHSNRTGLKTGIFKSGGKQKQSYPRSLVKSFKYLLRL